MGLGLGLGLGFGILVLIPYALTQDARHLHATALLAHSGITCRTSVLLALGFWVWFWVFAYRGDAKSLGVELRIRSPFPELGHSLAIFLPDYGHSR